MGSAFLAPSMALATEANTSSIDRVPSICKVERMRVCVSV